MFVSPGDRLYEGMVIGIHSRDNDLVVNPIKGKKLTNIRAAGKDDAILLTPPIALTLEYAVEFIADDELVEITPKSIRIRKRYLKEHERKRAGRLSAPGLASAAGEAEGRAQSRRGDDARARERHTQTEHQVPPDQGAREAKPSQGPKVAAARDGEQADTPATRVSLAARGGREAA